MTDAELAVLVDKYRPDRNGAAALRQSDDAARDVPVLVATIRQLRGLLGEVTYDAMGGEPDLFQPAAGWDDFDDRAQAALGKESVDRVDCPGRIAVGHETIACFASRLHPSEPHMAVVRKPCPTCGGYDEHAEGCADAENTTSEPAWFSWRDNATELTLAPDWVAQAWRNEYQP